MNYQVKLDIFQGPLDLLLHLIKKNRLEISDIPIAAITEQYLEYLDIIKETNLELAGEFVLMASTLVHIKSKMLLPVIETEDEVEEGPDPRAELMRRLLEYQRYKEAAEELMGRRLLGRDVFRRGVSFPLEELNEGTEDALDFTDVSLFSLMEAFKDILKKAPSVHTVDITVDRFKVQDKINRILETLEDAGSVVFSELFEEGAVKGEVIVTFLAILELAKLLMIKVRQAGDGEAGEGAIMVYRAAPPVSSGGETGPEESYGEESGPGEESGEESEESTEGNGPGASPLQGDSSDN